METNIEIEAQLRVYIAEFLARSPASVDWGAPLQNLSIGSMQFVEMMIDLQERFNVLVVHDDMESIASLDDLVRLLSGRVKHGPSFGTVADQAH